MLLEQVLSEECGGMASDTEDATKVASLVQEAKKNYEKASDAFKAARQGSADAQELQEQEANCFYSLPISHPETGAPVWTYRCPNGLASPMSLAQLFEMAHDTASEVSLDTPICNISQESALLLGEAAAKHPVMQERFQSMASADSAAEAAALNEKQQRAARQVAAYKLLEPQALLAWLSMGDELWIQCNTEPRALSVRQIQDLVLTNSLSACLEFRAPTNGQTPQAADVIVLEYETLAAEHLCAGSLLEESVSWAPDSLPEPSNLQCWQRSNSSAGPQVLHSSKAIMELFKAGRWEVQQRLSHCSRPTESMSFAAVHTGCERLSIQLRDLLRDPVIVPSSKAKAAQAELEERLARQVKQQLRDFVRMRCDEAELHAQQKSAEPQNLQLALEAKPAEGCAEDADLGIAVPRRRSPTCPKSKVILANGNASEHTHLNGHSTERTERASAQPQLAAAEEGKSLHAHLNGHSTGKQPVLSPDTDHRASQNGLRAKHDASLATDHRPAKRSRSPSRDRHHSRDPKSRQQLTDERPLRSRASDRWSPDERAGSSRRSSLQPERVHASRDRHRHADRDRDGREQRHTSTRHGEKHDQEHRHASTHHHRHSEQLSDRHRDRRRESSRNGHRSKTRSPSARRARERSTGPHQRRRGLEPICEATRSQSVQQAAEAVPASKQATEPAQVPTAQAPMAGAPDAAEAIAGYSRLPADPPEHIKPPEDAADAVDHAGDVRDVLDSLLSAAEHNSFAPHAADAPEADAASGWVHISSAPPAAEATLAAPSPSDAAEMPKASSAQPAAVSPAGNDAASPDVAGDDTAIVMVPAPDQDAAGHALSRLMLTEYETGLDWNHDSLDSIPDEPMLLLDVPFGPRIFATGMTRGEFLKQREEIGRIWRSQAPTGEDPVHTEAESDSASSQVGQQTCKQVVIINGRTGAVTQHSVPALQLSSAPDQPEPDSRQVEPHAEEASSEDELPLPEKPMSRRAARELGDLIEGLPETATSNRRRRQPVPFTDDWQSSKPPPLKKRKRSETPEDGVLLPCHTAAPAKAAKAPAAKAPTPKNASTGTAKASKAARAEAAALQHDESSQEDDRGWKLSDSKARELGDLMSGQQWDCSLPRGRRPPPGPSLPAALPSSLETVSKLKASAAQKDSTGKAPKASKAGKAKKRQRDPGKPAEREAILSSRMLPIDKVSRRSTITTRKAKRAVQVEEEASGTGRNVKRRIERNEEILNWRKLKGKVTDLKLIKSKVHAWGLTAVKPIQAEQFVIEYTGELIRLSVNSMRERLDSDSDYRFRVDDQWVVDATTKGGLARFINHCCDPNCYTKIVTVDNAKHILIFSKRGISAGEELSYDYKFETTPGEAPIPCTCGAKSCRGRLN